MPIPLWTFDVDRRHLRKCLTLRYWFSTTNHIWGLGPLPKNNLCLGPIVAVMLTFLVQVMLAYQLYITWNITPNHRDVDRRQNLDQSYTFILKPKFKTVSKRLFHWLITHPGVGIFLGFGERTENQWLSQWPACKEKWLLCCFAGPDKCPRPLNLQEEMLCVHLCFCSVFFLFLLEVCWHLVHVFSLLLFFAVFSCCYLWRFCVPAPILT